MKRKQVRKLKVESWKNTDKYLGYSDIISVLFDSQEEVTEDQLDKAIKSHLKREV